MPLDIWVDSIAFDGFWLQNANIITTKIDFDNIGEIDLNTFKFARDNGWGVLSKYYRGRMISMDVTVKESTASAFSTLLDTFKKNLRKTEWFLDITINDEIRRIKAAVKDIAFDRNHYNITYCNARITFQTVEPFFYAKNAQSFEFLAMSGSFYWEFSSEWSVESDPKIYILFQAGTTATGIDFVANGKTMTISQSFTSGDVLIIDAQNKNITKNGVEIDYTWQFPQFSPGSCPFNVAITWTSLMDMTIILPKNYL